MEGPLGDHRTRQLSCPARLQADCSATTPPLLPQLGSDDKDGGVHVSVGSQRAKPQAGCMITSMDPSGQQFDATAIMPARMMDHQPLPISRNLPRSKMITIVGLCSQP
eukprot:scaffold130705_cov30-Tisochrysis_lutea.AAC.1